MQTYRLSATLLITALSTPLFAQSEGGLLIEAEAEKKLNKTVSVNIEADLRTRNDFKTMDRWSVGAGISYKPVKWLKADAGYTLLDNNYREKTEYYTSSSGNEKMKWRPSYWGFRHRVHSSITGTYKFSNGIKLSLRERWQYTYRPEASPTRYKMKISDQEMTLDEDYVRGGKGKNQLRSRLQIEYDKKNALFTPYASMEVYNSWEVEKIRYTLGTDINLNKQHVFSVFYRLQDMKNVDADDYDPDMHYLGIGYKFKF